MSTAPNYRCDHCRSTARQCQQEEGQCCHSCGDTLHRRAVERVEAKQAESPFRYTPADESEKAWREWLDTLPSRIHALYWNDAEFHAWVHRARLPWIAWQEQHTEVERVGRQVQEDFRATLDALAEYERRQRLPYCFDGDCCDPEERSHKAEAMEMGLNPATLRWAGVCTECLRPDHHNHSIHCPQHSDPVPL